MGSFLYLVCYTFCTLLSLYSSFLLLTNKPHPSPALLKSLLRPWVWNNFRSLWVNPISLSYPFPFPLPLSFVHSRESKGYPNSRFDRGVGLRGRGKYPLKPSIFASLLETKGYPEHTAQPSTMSARSSRESHFRLK